MRELGALRRPRRNRPFIKAGDGRQASLLSYAPFASVVERERDSRKELYCPCRKMLS